VEAGLADAYARGGLPPAERAAWEERLRASPRLQERNAFARALAARASAPPRRRLADPPLLALAAALLVVVGGVVWMTVARGPEPRRQAALPPTPRPSAPSDGQPPTAESPASSVPRVPSYVTLALGLGTLRGEAGPARAALPPTADGLRLQAELESTEGFEQLRARVETDAGTHVFRADDLRRPSGSGLGTVEVTVPASALSGGTYILTVEGRPASGDWETLAVREFRVERR
jgi:hypothetical protein